MKNVLKWILGNIRTLSGAVSAIYYCGDVADLIYICIACIQIIKIQW